MSSNLRPSLPPTLQPTLAPTLSPTAYPLPYPRPSGPPVLTPTIYDSTPIPTYDSSGYNPTNPTSNGFNVVPIFIAVGVVVVIIASIAIVNYQRYRKPAVRDSGSKQNKRQVEYDHHDHRAAKPRAVYWNPHYANGFHCTPMPTEVCMGDGGGDAGCE